MFIVASIASAMLAAHPALQKGLEAYETQEYEAAVHQLTVAIQVPQLTREERRQAYDVLAKSHLALGDSAVAIDTYAALLAKDATAPVPEGAPKVREAFRLAKERVYPLDTVTLRALDAAAGELLFEIKDPWQRATDYWLYQRQDAARPFARSSLKQEGELLRGKAELAATAYYVEIWSQKLDRVVGGLGTAATPIPLPGNSITTEGAPARRAWPKWVVGAVTVLALGLTVGLFISSQSDSAAAGTAKFASERKALDDSAISKAIAADITGVVGAVGALGTVALWVF